MGVRARVRARVTVKLRWGMVKVRAEGNHLASHVRLRVRSRIRARIRALEMMWTTLPVTYAHWKAATRNSTRSSTYIR